MSVKVRIHPILQQFTDNHEMVEVAGQDVGECIESLEARFPGIKQRICDKKGKILNHLDIYVNAESSYPEELASPVNDGDELSIVTLIGGG